MDHDLKKAVKCMQKRMFENALEPIKAMVERGEITADMALVLVAHGAGNFGGRDDTPGYGRFRENSALIYENETFFESGYKESGFSGPAIEYKFAPPSKGYMHSMFKLYQHLSGKEYGSPEELRCVMRHALEGKRVLELGPGPGFNLKVLKDLGANVSGVELRREFIGGVPDADVRHGDAEHLAEIFGDEKFDVIYSADFFCFGAVLDQKKSGRIARSSAKNTKEGGLGLHTITYESIHPMLYNFSRWLSCREAGVSYEYWEREFERLSDDEQEDLLYTNRCSLDPQDLIRAGFGIVEYSAENGDLSIVARKNSRPQDKFW